MDLYHEHDIGDDVFVKMDEGRYLRTKVIGIKIVDSKFWIWPAP